MARLLTTIRNVDEADWSGDDAFYADYLRPVQECKAEVEVLSEAADGYYNIRLPNGVVLDAVSWFHLDGFTVDGYAYDTPQPTYPAEIPEYTAVYIQSDDGESYNLYLVVSRLVLQHAPDYLVSFEDENMYQIVESGSYNFPDTLDE